jgi:hypothetical protein
VHKNVNFILNKKIVRSDTFRFKADKTILQRKNLILLVENKDNYKLEDICMSSFKNIFHLFDLFLISILNDFTIIDYNKYITYKDQPKSTKIKRKLKYLLKNKK